MAPVAPRAAAAVPVRKDWIRQPAESQGWRRLLRARRTTHCSGKRRNVFLADSALRRYFYLLDSENRRPSLYVALGASETASLGDLRLAWRLRSLELDVAPSARRGADRAGIQRSGTSRPPGLLRRPTERRGCASFVSLWWLWFPPCRGTSVREGGLKAPFAGKNEIPQQPAQSYLARFVWSGRNARRKSVRTAHIYVSVLLERCCRRRGNAGASERRGR